MTNSMNQFAAEYEKSAGLQEKLKNMEQAAKGKDQIIDNLHTQMENLINQQMDKGKKKKNKK